MNIYRKFFKHAFNRAKFLDKCTDLSPQITVHLIKILLYPNSIDKNHWKGEIYDWVDELIRMNLKNEQHKKPSSVKKTLIIDSYWYDDYSRGFGQSFEKNVYKRLLIKYGNHDKELNSELKDIIQIKVMKLLNILVEYICDMNDDFETELDML